jgi:hypothetical protein
VCERGFVVRLYGKLRDSANVLAFIYTGKYDSAMSEKVAQTRDKGKTRRRLLVAAHELFYGGGIHATGVSAVAERARVTKMTL